MLKKWLRFWNRNCCGRGSCNRTKDWNRSNGCAEDQGRIKIGLETKTLWSACKAEPGLSARVKSEQAGGAEDCGDTKMRMPVDLRQYVLKLRKLLLLPRGGATKGQLASEGWRVWSGDRRIAYKRLLQRRIRVVECYAVESRRCCAWRLSLRLLSSRLLNLTKLSRDGCRIRECNNRGGWCDRHQDGHWKRLNLRRLGERCNHNRCESTS